MAESAFSACRRVLSTALDPNEISDWTEVTHSFHPLRGQRFPILKSRKLEQRDVLCLRGGQHGTLNVPRDWTDKADPLPWPALGIAPPVLSYDCLCSLAALVAALRRKS